MRRSAGSPLNIDAVAVNDEPNHLEKFCNAHVRVYEATIAPGRATEFHRHDRDTLYVVLAGGRFRSVEPGRQRAGTRLGRSVPLRRQLGWLVQRNLTGWLTMPAGTLLVQPHATHPLIHRVAADLANPRPVRMLGIELQRDGATPGADDHALEYPVEHRDARCTVYRLLLRHGRPTHLTLRNGAVLIAPSGTGDVVDDQARAITDDFHWLDAGTHVISSCAADPVHALLAVL